MGVFTEIFDQKKCFDEQDQKAIFNVKLVKNMTPVSNVTLLKIKESIIFQDNAQQVYAQRIRNMDVIPEDMQLLS